MHYQLHNNEAKRAYLSHLSDEHDEAKLIYFKAGLDKRRNVLKGGVLAWD